MRNVYTALLTAATVSLAVGGAFYLSVDGGKTAFEECRTGQVAGGTIGGPFTLVDHTGKTVTEAEVLRGPALVYFGYTFCPDVCPLDAARNADAVDILAKMGHKVTPVFITVDPERDTPEILADFSANLHADMIGLTGSPEQTKAAANAYKAYYAKHDDEDPEFYLVDHTSFTYLMLPEEGFTDFFRRETTAEQMAARTACFLDAAA